MGRYACIKSMRHSDSALAVVLCLLAGLLACADRQQAAGEGEIVIGVFAPVASTFFRSGAPTVEGAALAAKEINASGGVAVGGDRRRLLLVVQDTDGRPETAVSKALKLIASDDAAALIGFPISNSALAVAKVAEKHRVPMITTMSTNPETTLGRRFVFRAIFDDSFQGRLLADFAYGDLEARRAAILFDPGSAYSRGLAEVFRAVFEDHGGVVATSGSFTADESDASDRLRRIRSSGADVLVLPVYSTLLRPLIRQAREVGITAPAIGGDSWNLVAAGERGGWSPSFFSDVWAPDLPRPRSEHFIDSYREDYGSLPTSSAALAYDALFLLARAIELRGSSDPESIRSGLLALTDFAGVTGAIRYQGTGDPVRSAVIMRLADDGTAHLHRQLEP